MVVAAGLAGLPSACHSYRSFSPFFIGKLYRMTRCVPDHSYERISQPVSVKSVML